MLSHRLRVLLTCLATVGLTVALVAPADAGSKSAKDPAGDAVPKYDITHAQFSADTTKVSTRISAPDLGKTGTFALSFRQDTVAYGDYEYFGLVVRTKEAGVRGYVYVRSFADEEYRKVACPVSVGWNQKEGRVRIAVGLGGPTECPRFDEDLDAQVRALSAASALGLVIDFNYADVTRTKNVPVG